MYAKMLVAWAAIVICLSVSVQGQPQQDPLGSDIFTLPDDLRRTSSQDAPKVYIDPNADPLSIDSLMRQLDTEHTTEYLDRISGREYLGPIVPIAQELQGNWRLDLLGGMPGKVDLLLVQNRDAVFGRGTLSLAGTINDVSASGWTAKDVLYLDLVNARDLILYRCTLTMSRDYLSGGFNAYDAQGRAWSGTIQGGRPA